MSPIILPVPHFKQSDEGYCLPACARMVLAYLGIECSEAEISQLLGTYEFGTPSFAIQRLSLWGIEVNYRPLSLEKLLSTLSDRQPVIVFVQTEFLDYWEQNVAHAIVVVGIFDTQQFWVHDPAKSVAPLKVSLDGLMAAWGEFAYKSAVLQVRSQKVSRIARFLRQFLPW